MEINSLTLHNLTFSCKMEERTNYYSLKIIDSNLLKRFEKKNNICSFWYDLWHRRSTYLNEWLAIIQSLILSGPLTPLIEFYPPNYYPKREYYKYFEEIDDIKNKINGERLLIVNNHLINGTPLVRFIAIISEDSLLEDILNKCFEDLNCKIYLVDLENFDSEKFLLLTKKVSKLRPDNIIDFLNIGVKYYLHSNFHGDLLFCYSESKENLDILFIS